MPSPLTSLSPARLLTAATGLLVLAAMLLPCAPAGAITVHGATLSAPKAAHHGRRSGRRARFGHPRYTRLAHSSALPAASPNAPIIEAGFENNLANWNTAGLGEAMPTIDTSDARSGAKSGDFRLTGTQERSELSLGGNGGESNSGMVHFTEGDEYWYGFSFNIQQMVWGHPGAHNLIMQFKSEGEGSPEFGLQLWDFAGEKGLWSHSNPGPGAPGGDRFLAPVSENTWQDVTIHFKASSQGDGFYEIFLDGQLVESRSNVTMIVPGDTYAYIKDGIYRNGDAIPGTSEVLLDDAKLGTDADSVQPN